jgi:hypothetical protein
MAQILLWVVLSGGNSSVWLAEFCKWLRRFAEPRFKFGNPPLGRLKALPQRPDQGVLLGVAQVVEVGKLGHAIG